MARSSYSSLYRGAKKGIVLNGIEVAGLERALRDLGYAASKKELGKHVKPPLRDMAREMSAKAPMAEDESDQPQRKRGRHLRGALHSVRAKSGRGGRTIGWAITGPTRKRLGIGDWPQERGYYPAHVELGTSRMPARPYMRPVWDRGKEGLVRTIAKSLADWVDNVWRRGR